MAQSVSRPTFSRPSEGFSNAFSLEHDEPRLRVFLIQTAKGLFSSSGGYKANLCFLRYLASRGHAVRQICYSHGGEVVTYLQTMTKSGRWNPQYRTRVLHLESEDGRAGTKIIVEEFVMQDGVQTICLDKEAFDEAFGGKGNILQTMSKETADYIEKGLLSARLLNFISFLQQEIANFSPTHVMFNDGLSMKATSQLEMPGLSFRRIAIIHTAEQLPFGPFSGGMPGHVSSAGESELLQELDGIWSSSEAIKRYALEHGRLSTDFFVHHPWTYLHEENHTVPTRLHNCNKSYIGMINPCKVKGLQILVGLARSSPQYDFLVFKSWGFNEKAGDELRQMQNITIRPSFTDMDEAWRDIKILLVPSLWFEAWGIVVIEAHLRGIPVISSDAGALTETMLGLNSVIPVNPIRGELDDDGEYMVPQQDIGPWVKAVDRLMSDKSEYEKLSNEVRSVTEQWLRNLDQRALEKWLIDLSLRTSKAESL